LIINGDLTAFGHEEEMDKYCSLLGNLGDLQYYPGLGNHDYYNNVDDSFNNNCASRMVNWMYDWLRARPDTVSYDFTESSDYEFPTLCKDYSGSLSYSFNIHNVHVIQLQNYLGYTREWWSWNAAGARKDNYYIRSGLNWLLNDLAQARNRGDIIIVNVHDFEEAAKSSEFIDALKTYGVTLVFSGHIHCDCGLYKIIGTGQNKTYVFRSGSSSYQDYLVVEVDSQNQKVSIRKRVSTTTSDATLEDDLYKYTNDCWKYDLNASVPNPPLPIPTRDGYVRFYNDGGFVARFYLKYTHEGQTVELETGDTCLGNKMTYIIPGNATGIQIIGKECTGLAWEWWRTVFNLSLNSAPNKCYRLYGGTLTPEWDNDE
jgi:hypothetical protein